MCVLYRTRTAYSSSPHPSHHRRGAVCAEILTRHRVTVYVRMCARLICGVCLRVLCFRTGVACDPLTPFRSYLPSLSLSYTHTRARSPTHIQPSLSLSLTRSLTLTQLLLAHCTVHVLLCCTSYSPATEHPVHIDRRARDGRLAVDVWLHHHKAAPLSVARVAPRHVVHTPLIAKPPPLSHCVAS